MDQPTGAPARRLDRVRALVYLPDGYSDTNRRFPILYLLHGCCLQSPYHWLLPWLGYRQEVLRDPREPRNVTRLISGTRAVVVMPEGGSGGFYSNAWNGGRRTDPGWQRHHLDELLPLVERRFRIRPGRRWHAIAGWSMGGYGALLYASQRPGYFGTAASMSGTLQAALGLPMQNVWGDPAQQRFYYLGHSLSALTDNLRASRLFVRVGDARARTASDRRDAAFASLEALARTGSQEFARVARRRGLRLTFRLRRGVHDAPYLRQGLQEFVAWGPFKAVAERPRRWTHKTVAASGDVFGFSFSFAEPPDTLITFRRSGGRFSASGSGTVAVRTPDGRRFTATVPFSRRIGAG